MQSWSLVNHDGAKTAMNVPALDVVHLVHSWYFFPLALSIGTKVGVS
jgi:hypothetical protein